MPYKDPHSEVAKESRKRINKKFYEENKVEIMAYKKRRYPEYYRKNRHKWLEKYNARSSATRRKRMFGISSDEYEKMLFEQSSKCKICGVERKELSYSLCVDHDHKSGRIRGLLCHGCNTGIGRFKENIISLQNAIIYLSN